MADPNITRGAELKAAARTLGMGEDELMTYLQRRALQQSYELEREVGINEVLKGTINRTAAVESQLQQEDLGTLGLDKYYEGNFEFGDDQADLQPQEFAKDGETLSKVERDSEDGASRLRRRVQEANADLAYENLVRERGRRGLKGESEQAQRMRQRNEIAEERLRVMMARGPVAFPQQSTVPEAQKLRAKINSGTLTPVQVEQAERLISRLRQDTEPGYQAAMDFDAGSRAVRESGANFNPEIRAQNEAAANQAEGKFISSTTSDRIGEVRIMKGAPGAKTVKDFIGAVPRLYSEQNDPNNFPQAELQINPKYAGDGLAGFRYLDSDGNPISTQGAALPPSGNNVPGAGQDANAPQGGASLFDVMERNQFSNRQSGTYPQVDIGSELQMLTERLQKVGVSGSGGIRSLEDAQGLFDEAISLGQQSGAKFNALGSKQIVDNPGAEELLAKMRYSGPEVARLANALIQVEAGNRQVPNQAQKAAYASGLAAQPYQLAQTQADNRGPLLVGPQQLSIAQRNSEMTQNARPAWSSLQETDFNGGTALASNKKDIAPKFAALTGENIEGDFQERREALGDAQRNYQGMVRGETPVPIKGKQGLPNYRFNRTGQTEPADIQGAIQDQAEMRAAEQRKPVDQKRVDSVGRNAVAVQMRADNPSSIGSNEEVFNEAFKRRREVARHVARDKPPLKGGTSGRRAGNPAERAREAREGMGLRTMQAMGQNTGRVVTPQPAPVPGLAYESLFTPQAPDPWTQEPATGRGFTSGPAPVKAKPQLALPYGVQTDGPSQGPTRPITAGLRNELASLAAGTTGRNTGEYAFQADGPGRNTRVRDEGDYLQSVRNLSRVRKFGRNAAITGGAVAGLAGIDGLINGERNRREEEVMYR